MTPDRVVITVRHVRRHRAGADRAGRSRATRCWSRCRPIRSTRRCSRRSARGRSSTARDPSNGWLPDVDDIRSADHARPRARSSSSIRTTRPARPIPTTCAARCSRSPTSTTSRCSPTRSTATSPSTARCRAIAQPRSRRAGHHVLVAVEGVPRAGLALRLAGGRPDRAARRRARRDQEAGGRPPVQHRPDGVRDRRGARPATARTSRRSARRCANART